MHFEHMDTDVTCNTIHQDKHKVTINGYPYSRDNDICCSLKGR